MHRLRGLPSPSSDAYPLLSYHLILLSRLFTGPVDTPNVQLTPHYGCQTFTASLGSFRHHATGSTGRRVLRTVLS